MNISDYQISTVIRTYMKNMKIRMGQPEKAHVIVPNKTEVNISKEAMKKMLYDRIGEQMSEKLKKYDLKDGDPEIAPR